MPEGEDEGDGAAETPSPQRSSLALRARLPAPRATIVASSTRCALFLQQVRGCGHIAPSMGRAGCALDNALAEPCVAAQMQVRARPLPLLPDQRGGRERIFEYLDVCTCVAWLVRQNEGHP